MKYACFPKYIVQVYDDDSPKTKCCWLFFDHLLPLVLSFSLCFFYFFYLVSVIENPCKFKSLIKQVCNATVLLLICCCEITLPVICHSCVSNEHFLPHASYVESNLSRNKQRVAMTTTKFELQSNDKFVSLTSKNNASNTSIFKYI